VTQVLVLAPTIAVRAGLRALLDANAQIEVMAEAANLGELETLPVGVDVLVGTFTAIPTTDLAEFLQEVEPAPALLLLTDSPAELQEYTRLPLRAWGALPLDASENELAAAVLALHEGLVVGSLPLMQPLTDQVVLTSGNADLIVEELTARETEVLQLLAYGLANKQIAYELDISEHTVKFHVSSIYTKLGATNRTEAVRLGVRLGLIVL